MHKLQSDIDEKLMTALAQVAGLDIALQLCPQSIQLAWATSRKSAKALEVAQRSVAKDSLICLHGAEQ